MTDETAVETKTEVVTEGEQPQYTVSEQQAMATGWKPKDQWDGDPDDWVPARQYIKNGELFGRINSYKNKIVNLEKTVGELVKHNEKIYETGYKDAIDTLKQERKQALREGDTERVLELEERAEALQQEYEEKKQDFKQSVQTPQVATNPIFDEWLANNPWYEQDAALHGYADGEARTLVEASQRAGKVVDYDKLLVEVSRKVRDKFPEKFGMREKMPSAVTKGDEPTTRRASSSDNYKLTPMEEEIFKTLEKSGLTKEKYVEDLKKVKARKGE